MISNSKAQFFKIPNFRNVDATGVPAAYIEFLDRFATERRDMIDIGLDLLNLSPGSTVLDVGCGHGATLTALATRVGPTGHVTGIDLSNDLVTEGHRRLSGVGLPVQIKVGNAQSLNFPNATFDATRADRVLAFVPEPASALLELARVTRPGGRVVVTEPDLGASMVDSSDASTTREVLANVCAGFPNPWVGRQLRALFLNAGLVDVEVRFFTAMNTSLAEWYGRMGVDDALRTSVDSGRISAVSAKAWIDELLGRDAEGRFFSANTFCMVAGTQPESQSNSARELPR